MCETSSDFVNNYKAGQALAEKLIETLGLPKRCLRIEIIFTANEPVIIKCEHYPQVDDYVNDEVDSLISEFVLVPKQ